MTRLLVPSLLVLSLMIAAPVVQAADAEPALSEAQKLDEATAKKVEEKSEEKKTEEKAEKKKSEEKKTEEKSAEKAEEKKEEVKAEETKEPELSKEAEEHRKASQDVYEQTRKIAEGLSPDEQKHFFLLYNNYNLIGTVKMVQGDVGKAVEACGTKNPDMKDAMDSRYAEWSGAVDPVIKEAEGNVSNMVSAQDYAKKADIEKIFKGLDKTRDIANKQIDKMPVTSEDACQYLLENMSETQENFVRLLQETLMSVPKAIPSAPAPEEKKAEEPATEKKDVEKKAEKKKAEKEPAAEAPAEPAEDEPSEAAPSEDAPVEDTPPEDAQKE